MNCFSHQWFYMGYYDPPAVNRQGTCDLLLCRVMLNLICINQHHHKHKMVAFQMADQTVLCKKNVHDGTADQSFTSLLHDSVSQNDQVFLEDQIYEPPSGSIFLALMA